MPMNEKEYIDRLMIQMMPMFAQLTANDTPQARIVRSADEPITPGLSLNPENAQAAAFNFCKRAGAARTVFWEKHDEMMRAIEKQQRAANAAAHAQHKKSGNGGSRPA